MNEILVSIIIPIYNAENYLAECIGSVIAMKDNRWQLILINDGSRDSSAEICKDFCKKDSRIIYIEQDNAGVSVARNNGIKHATGEWIAFLDSDDMLSPDSIELLDLATQNDDMVVAGITRKTKGYVLSKEYQYLSGMELQKSILNLCKFKAERSDVTSINVYNRWSSCGRFYRNRIIQENDIKFPVGIKLGEDLIFCMEYSQKINRVVVNESYIYYYRENPKSVTQKFHNDRVENTIKMVNRVAQSLYDGTLVKYLNVFIVDRITKCCLEYYADVRNGMSKKKAAEKLREFCEISEFQKAISECGFSYLAIGKKNRLYSTVTLIFLKGKLYLMLIYCLKILRMI